MRRHLIGAGVLALALAGCGAGAEPTASEPIPPSTTTLAVVSDLTPTLPLIGEGVAREVAPLPDAEPELDAEQIVTAMVVIASGGDLEAAITAGIVGEAEAEAALVALEAGSIDDLFD